MSGLHTLLKSARADIACSKKPHSKQMILKGANMMNKLISYFGTFTPGADGAVGAFQFEYLTSLGFAALVIFAGRAIVRRSHVLRKFAIPAPGDLGLLFSVLIAFQGNWHSCHFFRYKRFATFRYYCLMHVYAPGWFDGYFSSALNFCFCGIVMLPP